MAWLLATKLEMTRIVKENGFVPVTLIKIPTLKVVAIKTMETDGYNSLVIWVLREGKEWNLREGKKTLSFNDFSRIKEILLKDDEVSKYNVWDNLTIDSLEWVVSVDITWYSKWKWFTWAMKRHNFAWWRATHGSKFHRALWSIGNRKPRRTHKGKKMHWHMWNDKVTLKWVSVELTNKDLSVVGLKWPIPWARNSLISIKF